MKKSILLISVLISLNYPARSQDVEKHAPVGYDNSRTGILHGKIDTVTYASKTVGTNRKALIYTPPSYSKKQKISCSIPFTWYWR